MTRVFRRTFRALSAALSVILLAGRAGAQSVSGSISGDVVDQSHQVVPGATVTLTDEQTGAQPDHRDQRRPARSCFVRAAGALHRAHRDGRFGAVERKNITLPANERLSMGTVVLPIGGVTETVTTMAEGSFVQTPAPSDRRSSPSKQLEMVAVRGRDVVSLLRVLPGVSYQGESEAPGGSFGTTTRTSAATATPGTPSPSTGWSATTSAARRSSAARSTSTRSAR